MKKFKDLLSKLGIEPAAYKETLLIKMIKTLKFNGEELDQIVKEYKFDNPQGLHHTMQAADFWHHVCWYQKLEDRFIEKYKDHLDWEVLCTFHKLTPEFVTKYINYIDEDIVYNPYYNKLPSSVKLLLKQKFERR